MDNKYDLIVVGAGPAGIATAFEAYKANFSKILLLEKTDRHSATIRQYYKDGKRVDKDYKGQTVDLRGNIPITDTTKEGALELLDNCLSNDAIEILFNSEVESIIKSGESFEVSTTDNKKYTSKYVVVTIGKMGRPNKPSYSIPFSINALVNFNIDKCKTGEKILVVGGGNSAVEYAYSLDKDNDVTINYRRAEFTRPNETNLNIINEHISSGQLKTKLGVDISSLADEGGKILVNYTDGSSEQYDRIVYALGGVAPVDFLKKCNIALDDSNVPIIKDHYESSVDGLYVAGDVLYKSGGSIAMGLNVAFDIINHIKSLM